MKNEIRVFENVEFGSITTIIERGEVWFMAKDIASVLEYNHTPHMLRMLESDEKLVSTLRTGGQNRRVNFINESGLYSAVLRSNKPEAKNFRRWITSEVIPSIRKHGAYMTDVTIEKVLTDPDLLISLATALKEGKEREEKLKNIANQQYKEIELQEAKLKEQRPDVLFSKSVKKNGNDCLVGELAKIICQNGVVVGQNRLFEWLRDSGYLIKEGRQKNVPKQQYIENGLFRIAKGEVETKRGNVIITSTTMVTPKGQSYFVNKYLEDVEF